MYSIRDLFVARDDITMKPVNEFFVGPIGGMGAVFLGDNQTRSAGGTGSVIIGVLIGGLAILGIVRQVRTKDDAVASLDWSKLQRCP